MKRKKIQKRRKKGGTRESSQPEGIRQSKIIRQTEGISQSEVVSPPEMTLRSGTILQPGAVSQFKTEEPSDMFPNQEQGILSMFSKNGHYSVSLDWYDSSKKQRETMKEHLVIPELRDSGGKKLKADKETLSNLKEPIPSSPVMYRRGPQENEQRIGEAVVEQRMISNGQVSEKKALLEGEAGKKYDYQYQKFDCHTWADRMFQNTPQPTSQLQADRDVDWWRLAPVQRAERGPYTFRMPDHDDRSIYHTVELDVSRKSVTRYAAQLEMLKKAAEGLVEDDGSDDESYKRRVTELYGEISMVEYAARQSLKVLVYSGPGHGHGRGVDMIAEKNGVIVVIEAKGPGAKLAPGQMSHEWVSSRIQLPSAKEILEKEGYTVEEEGVIRKDGTVVSVFRKVVRAKWDGKTITHTVGTLG